MIVIDCSALVTFVLSPLADIALSERIRNADELAAPDLLDVECLSALRRLEFSKRLATADAEQALSHFQLLRIERFPVHDLLDHLWQLRKNFGAYDAAYVALATSLQAPLLTRDLRLQRAVAAHTAIALL